MLKPIRLHYPSIIFTQNETDKLIKKVGELSISSHMQDKRICFFGDGNKVMEFNCQSNTWTKKQINNYSNDFLYYAAAVTLPNGDALIIGGGSSTTVYQFSSSTGILSVREPMKQMRKEHSAVICDNTVYVMGGYDGLQSIFLNLCEQWDCETNTWKDFEKMNIAKCAFSACVVNRKYIYTFGGYDGTKRLDTIERYDLGEKYWELLRVKLRFSLSNCACFSPFMNKVVIFGGGFSSGFSQYVEIIDVETGEWKSLPKMKEGRDLRNKVVYVDGAAYAIGGLNKKCEKLVMSKRKWVTIPDYVINDNLDSWSCALMYTPNDIFTEKDMEEFEYESSDGDQMSEDEEEEGDRSFHARSDCMSNSKEEDSSLWNYDEEMPKYEIEKDEKWGQSKSGRRTSQ